MSRQLQFAPRPFLFRPRPLRAAGGGDGTGAGRGRRSAALADGGQRALDMTRQDDGAGADPASARLPSGMAQPLSALFYGTCSFLIVLVNKALLTTYG